MWLSHLFPPLYRGLGGEGGAGGEVDLAGLRCLVVEQHHV